MSSININLTIGYHNIEGQHNTLLGCKLGNYIKLINDIEILAETWSVCNKCKNITIENYHLLKVIDPLKYGRIKGRKSGGIHIYCKSHLKPHLKITKTSTHYIWFEVSKNFFEKINSNLLICAIYSQPRSSAYYSEEIWEEIEHDLINLTSNDPYAPSPFCIMGDMNGRVAEESEFIQKSINDDIIIPTRSTLESSRRNCDKVKCTVGDKIIHLCKSYDMQIANGRMPGDFLGNFTHHNKNTGQSTVDLALISDGLYPLANDFQVLPQPLFSDHCKIVLTIKNLKPIEANQNNYQWLNRKLEYKWDKNSPEKFQQALKSTKVIELITSCNHRIEAGLIESSGELLQQIFHEAAEISLQKKENKN